MSFAPSGHVSTMLLQPLFALVNSVNRVFVCVCACVRVRELASLAGRSLTHSRHPRSRLCWFVVKNIVHKPAWLYVAVLLDQLGAALVGLVDHHFLPAPGQHPSNLSHISFTRAIMLHKRSHLKQMKMLKASDAPQKHSGLFILCKLPGLTSLISK